MKRGLNWVVFRVGNGSGFFDQKHYSIFQDFLPDCKLGPECMPMYVHTYLIIISGQILSGFFCILMTFSSAFLARISSDRSLGQESTIFNVGFNLS